MCIRVVHDCEVLLVDVVLLQRKGNIGESKPELVVDRNLKNQVYIKSCLSILVLVLFLKKNFY